jgi:predicted DNA-binding transcriptional regulator AlpA
MKKPAPVLNAMGVPIENDDRHVSFKEAMAQVNLGKHCINNLIERGQFPPKHYPIPSRVAFWQSELDEWHKTGAFVWYERYGKQQLADKQRAQSKVA